MRAAWRNLLEPPQSLPAVHLQAMCAGSIRERGEVLTMNVSHPRSTEMDWIDIAKWLLVSLALLALAGGASLAWFLNHAD
jgi:hypothetical protein